jgi:hypothetical protein
MDPLAPAHHASSFDVRAGRVASRDGQKDVDAVSQLLMGPTLFVARQARNLRKSSRYPATISSLERGRPRPRGNMVHGGKTRQRGRRRSSWCFDGVAGRADAAERDAGHCRGWHRLESRTKSTEIRGDSTGKITYVFVSLRRSPFAVVLPRFGASELSPPALRISPPPPP